MGCSAVAGAWGSTPRACQREAGGAGVNRERKLARGKAGTAHAALVFDGEHCVGWCQFGPPEKLPRIKSKSAYHKTLTASPPEVASPELAPPCGRS